MAGSERHGERHDACRGRAKETGGLIFFAEHFIQSSFVHHITIRNWTERCNKWVTEAIYEFKQIWANS